MKKIFLTTIIIVCCLLLSRNFFKNIYLYLRCKKIKSLYIKWLQGKQISLVTYKSEFLMLMNEANIHSPKVITHSSDGIGGIVIHTTDAFENFPTNDPQQITFIINSFDEALGSYILNLKSFFMPGICPSPNKNYSSFSNTNKSFFILLIQYLGKHIFEICAIIISIIELIRQ